MNTCRATLRVLSAHKLYLIIYLVLIGVMMFSLSWSALSQNAAGAGETTYDPGRPRVAVVDRDHNRGNIAQGLRSYLSASSDLTDVPDDPESLQQAVASNWADLIVIIPDGFAQGMLDSAAAGNADDAKGAGDQPSVETVTSYTSGAGTMAGMTVNGFLSITRTALVGSAVQVDVPQQVLDAIKSGLENPDAAAGATGTNAADGNGGNGNAPAYAGEPSEDELAAMPKGTIRSVGMDDLAKAVDRAVAVSRDGDVNHAIAVVDVPSATSAAASDATADGFGGTMQTALYPLFLAMTICTSIILGAFTTGEVRRRLSASPQRMSVMGLQRAATLCGFALVVCLGYLVVTFALMAAAGLNPARLDPAGAAMTFCSACVYALMTVACGFMLSEFGASEIAANGFANIFGLLIMFSSGISVPLSIMPAPMVTLAKLLPGWWYCVSIDDALGIGSAAKTGASATGWLGALGLVALFGAAFVCVGLAAGRMRRMRKANA